MVQPHRQYLELLTPKKIIPTFSLYHPMKYACELLLRINFYYFMYVILKYTVK